MAKIEASYLELEEKVVNINRVAKVVKGGRRFSLAALVVVGDGSGHIGIGQGKGKEVPIAVQKAAGRARKSLIKVPLKGSTIPHQVLGIFGAGKVLLKPAAPGTGIIAGGPVRAIMELAGVKDILAKSLGSENSINMIKATVEGLKNLMDETIVSKNRGVELDVVRPKVKDENVAAQMEIKAAKAALEEEKDTPKKLKEQKEPNSATASLDKENKADAKKEEVKKEKAEENSKKEETKKKEASE